MGAFASRRDYPGLLHICLRDRFGENQNLTVILNRSSAFGNHVVFQFLDRDEVGNLNGNGSNSVDIQDVKSDLKVGVILYAARIFKKILVK
jgi:hypothetical protein